MQINNEILNDFIICHYKAYRKSKHQTGIIPDYQSLYNQLKQKGKENFERTITKNNNLTVYHQNCENNAPEEGIFLNFKFANANIDITLDGIEFTGNNTVIPIFITPFENITKYDKQFIVLQSSYIKNEFSIHVDSCKVIYGKLQKQTKYKLSLSTRSIKKSIDDLNRIISDSVEPSLVLNNHCIVCEYRANCMEKAKADDSLSLLDRATTKVIDRYKKKGIFTVQQLSYLYKPSWWWGNNSICR